MDLAITMKNETKWSVDTAHSEMGFKIRHLKIAHVKGIFKTFDAIIYTADSDFKTASIDLWIDPASISTGDILRDKHLKSVDFFDVMNHERITFTSSGIGAQDKEGNHEMWGELTIKGIANTIKLKVQFGGMITNPWGNEKAGFSVTGEINRMDWGLNWNTAIGTGGLLMEKILTISCEFVLIRSIVEELVDGLESAPEVTAI